jgi:hypothetical protein
LALIGLPAEQAQQRVDITLQLPLGAAGQASFQRQTQICTDRPVTQVGVTLGDIWRRLSLAHFALYHDASIYNMYFISGDLTAG